MRSLNCTIMPRLRRLLAAIPVGLIMVSSLSADPLDTWHVRTSGTGLNLDAVTHASGTFVAVGQSGVILVSGDGTNWTQSASGVSTNLHGVSWGANRFVVVGDGGTILTSSNALIWTQRSSPGTEDLNAVRWLDGRFLAVGGFGTILDSTNGLAWTSRNSGTTYGLKSLAHGNGVFCVGAKSSSNTGLISSSSDGITWSNQLGGGFHTLYDMAFGHGRFVALSVRSLTQLSTDGTVWNRGQAGNNASYLFGITFAQGLFVAVGGPYSSGSQKIVTSTDGINWQQRSINTGYSPSLQSVVYGNGSFVTVGGKGLILQSDPYWKLSATGPVQLGSSIRWKFAAEANRDYRFQYANPIGVVVWSNLFNFTTTNEMTILADPTASNSPTRLYRVISP